MKQYFINRDGTPEGPFSIEEIRSLDLSPNTPVMEADSGSREWRPLSVYNIEDDSEIDATDVEYQKDESSDVDESYLESSGDVDDNSSENNYQQYVDNWYNYTFDLMAKKNYNAEEAFRDLVKQGVPVELAKTIVNNSSDVIRKHNNNIASIQLVIGFVSFIIGTGSTIVSYNDASPGGTYIVAWGAMLFGVVEIFRGIFGFNKKKRFG